MEQTFLTELRIEKVRHLHDITIPLSKTERKNLILTGKNGSGKTSVLEALRNYINSHTFISDNLSRISQKEAEKYIALHATRDRESKGTVSPKLTRQSWDEIAEKTGFKCKAFVNDINQLKDDYIHGKFILAYYGDSRNLDLLPVDHIEKVHLKEIYGMNEKPSKELGKFLVDLESTRAFALAKGDHIRTAQINNWFTRFENILRRIYGDPSLKLDFNIDTFQFSILIDGREPFDFNTMSMGYAAVFDIVADLMMRMESQRRYDLEGIVLIDEIETHLHVELQKQIVPILTELFPNIQFILTTHSPFILSSAPNAVIYDLEKHLLVSEGMKNLSYEGIVEGYFGVDAYSEELRNAFEEYKHLVTASELTDVQRARLAALRDYLDEVPDYLAREIAYEYSLLRLEYDD